MQPLRVVVLGTSFGGSVHATGFQRHPGFEVVGMAGTDAARTRRAADAAGVALASTDWRALLDEAKPDVVSIVTPPDLHHPMTLAALERSCHVLCEKPTALDRHQAVEMRARAAAAGRVLAINHEFRFFPARMRALELVREGAIGAPRRGEILGRYALWPRPESRPMTWLADRARGGGILGALGSHHTDCLRTFFGEPESVLATVRVGQPRRGPTPTDSRLGIATADDGFTMHLEFPGHVTGIVDADATTPYRWERFEIHGEEATLRWDETGYALWRIPTQGGRPPAGSVHATAGAGPEVVEIPERLRLAPVDGDPALVAPFGVLVARFHAAIREGVPMTPNFDDAVAVQRVLDAARHSSDTGARQPIDVPVIPPATSRI
jgi:predicted dehydrogenase